MLNSCVCVQVFVKREAETISLIVDGIITQSKRIPSRDQSGLNGMLYVGGVPPALKVKQTSPGCSNMKVTCVTFMNLVGRSGFRFWRFYWLHSRPAAKPSPCRTSCWPSGNSPMLSGSFAAWSLLLWSWRPHHSGWAHRSFSFLVSALWTGNWCSVCPQTSL